MLTSGRCSRSLVQDELMTVSIYISMCMVPHYAAVYPRSLNHNQKTCYEKCEHASGDQVDGRKSSRKLGSDQKKKKPRPKPETEDKADDDESGYR